MSPALAGPRSSAPRSRRPPPLAEEASTRPPPPLLPAPRRLSSAPSCVPIPAPTSAVVPPTSQVTAADKPGRASRSASRPPPSYSHTPPPGAASLKTWGRHAQASSASGRGEEGGGEEGRPTPTQSAALRLCPAAPPPLAPHSARTGSAHPAHLSADCKGRPGPRGRWPRRASGLLGFYSVKAKARASSCAAWRSPAPSPPHCRGHARLPKATEAQMNRAILHVRSYRPAATVTCASLAAQAPPLVSVTWDSGWAGFLSSSIPGNP
ncbi:formin-like protein 5 [Cebus imitator]|uniref:formin-like protein 5 n=1 Tax=Cebus imitator TaxID=2715852 RepID=UPI0018995E4A|nr:formin-like protein 5 [Cebus imitator]